MSWIGVTVLELHASFASLLRLAHTLALTLSRKLGASVAMSNNTTIWVLIFYIAVVLLSTPIWWRETRIYRAELPLQEIATLSQTLQVSLSLVFSFVIGSL